ncbi:hypothetical protein [Halorussus pelagicus]|uniref:hypothetical protein n=1 Tax=Halorussus pelagicus TaxID=2505977 RepID=UPI000FFBE930|nr:hypothetical protein [Halorussus pelagicus]
MVRRRTIAVVEFVGAGVMLLALFPLWRRASEDDEALSVSPSDIAAGGVGQFVRYWARDRDVAGIRSRRSRWFLAHLAWSGWGFAVRRRSDDSENASKNFHVGALAATTAYRLWYGVLNPLPDDTE